MADEKLEFSMEDLGRLSHELHMKNASIAHQVIFDWLRGFEADETKHRAIWDALWRGYTDAKMREDERLIPL